MELLAQDLPHDVVRSRKQGGGSVDYVDGWYVITRLNEAGVSTGLGAFSPPGTRPPLIGLAVPEDFALPPGYVRHHQATDDGQRIEAILMYAPDHPLAAGATSAQDRVVPADRLPPGLPARLVTVPPPASPGK